MKSYSIDLVAYRQALKKVLIYRILLILLVIGCCVFAGLRVDESGDYLYISLPIVLLIVAFALYRGITRQRSIIRSYVLTIDENRITREQLNTPTISLSFMEIKEVRRTRKGSYLVRADRPGNLICIPYYIQDYQELEQQLLALGSFSIRPDTNVLRRLPWLFPSIVLPMYLAVFLSENKLVVALCGVGSIAVHAWSFYQRLTNKNVTHEMRRRRWVNLLIIGVVIYFMYVKLTA